MYRVQVVVQSADKFFEVLPGETENAELVIEDLVSHILLEHFDEVIVDRVTVNFSSNPAREQSYWSICIEAYCQSSSLPFSAPKLKSIEQILKGRISSSLVELLGKINAQSIIIRFTSWENTTP